MNTFGARFEYRKDLYNKSKELRKEQTIAERVFWRSVLKTHPFNQYTWNRQKPIHQFIADFYCSKQKIVIEIDGEIHKYSTDYDNARTRYLNELGLTVLRYTNDQVLHCIEKVRADLLTYLHPESSPAPSLFKEGE